MLGDVSELELKPRQAAIYSVYTSHDENVKHFQCEPLFELCKRCFVSIEQMAVPFVNDGDSFYGNYSCRIRNYFGSAHFHVQLHEASKAIARLIFIKLLTV